MMRLNDRLRDVPSGWGYTVPETEVWFRSHTLETLIELVRTHYEINHIDEPEDLAGVIEDSICRGLPAGLKGRILHDDDR